MPSTYAHYRLGQQVADELPLEIKEIIERNKELYDIGLHGPDILFYYRPFNKNKVNQTGFGMHDEAAGKFFESAARVIRSKTHRKEACLAYIYGFICHFVLDSECHGYIDEKIQESGVSHTEIEVEFDRDLLLKDGYEPVRKSLVDHIIPSDENAEIISGFFSEITKEEIKEALESMIRYNKMLVAPSRIKRTFIYGLLGITGNYKEMQGLIVNFIANPKCKDSTERLNFLYQRAVKESVRLISEYETSKEQVLDTRYRLTFGSRDTTEAKKEEVYQ